MEAQVTEAKPRSRAATRQRLLEAARGLFAEHGYEQVTVRMIAAAAEANIALVGRYFGSKAGLFSEVLAGEPTVAGVLEGEPEGLARRLAEFAVARMHSEPESPILRSLERSAGDPEIRELVRDRLRNAIISPMAANLTGDDALSRARLATAVFLGIGTMRRLLGPEPPSPDDVDRLTAVFEACFRP
ncbi:TetR family transcriptional regulator [Nonomuraea sp. NBC_01738]|uniref:TetR/AcrR family transcriptional regulator n=1 Tax=Nonomuraea sp. NBC_01738 TaxID=2976003 RepID=UPI002E0D80B5|nr:TetR family transcriptional regulator [Nonomuraea sp. NBC_01738]